MELKLSSSAFEDGQEIPRDFSGEGRDISPPLRWSNVPEGTREFALICEDPDAPGREPFVHWLIYNISPSVTSLPEGIPQLDRLTFPLVADQGLNSFGEIGFRGPMPPEGHGWHRYLFKIFALDSALSLPPGATREMFLYAIRCHLLNEGLLIGVYRREAKRLDKELRGTGLRAG